MNEHEQLSGIIDRFLFQSTDTGYAVFVLTISAHASTIVKGYIPALHPGQQVQLEGVWTTHPKFGKQFDAKKCTASVPATTLGLKKYLGSGLIKGIGKVYAEKLVDRFGDKVLDIIDNDPDQLKRVDGIGPKRLEQIIAAWKDQKEVSSIMIFLQEKGVSPAYAAKIYKHYGKNAIAQVTENPYRLAEDVWGIGFKMADQVAQGLGFERTSLKRIAAGLLFLISQKMGQGHLYVELNQLRTETATLLEIDFIENEHTIKLALHELYETAKIRLISWQEHHYIAATPAYFAEKAVATKIQLLQTYPCQHAFNLDEIYTAIRVEQAHEIALNEDQQRGILSCLQHTVSIVTGGPGTGKTTLIKKLLSVLDEHNLSYKLAAPTGRAAKRIMEGTGRFATTIHRLLEFDVSSMSFTHNEQNALKLDFLIIDEASMIDIFLAHAILKAVPHTAHIVLIGDINQLPPVGAGNFLNDLIASGIIPCIHLTHIFRQAQDSLIIVNAHRINQGEFPVSSLPDAKKDFIFIKETDPTNVGHHLQEIFKRRLGMAHIRADDAMVLVPMNRGIVGTQQLNDTLQKLLNPDQHAPTLTKIGTTFKQGDRVMQIRNNYDKDVYNGDIGYITTIDQEDRILTVNFGERIIEYQSDELDELVLAYAISIHKSQGSEYTAAIIPIFMQHFILLQRNLVYTAITRAKKLCIFIGEPRALAVAIKNDKSIERTTFLRQFLTTDLACR